MSTDLTDEDLTAALSAAAASYPVPESHQLDEELADAVTEPSFWRRRGVQLTAMAAALVVGAVVVGSIDSGQSMNRLSAPAASYDRSGESGGGTTGAAPPPASNLSSGNTNAVKANPTSGLGGGIGGVAQLPDTTSSGGGAARVVKTGTMSLVVDDGKVGAAVARLQKLAGDNRGYLSDQQSQELGDSPSARLTMRVPVARFDAVIAAIRSKGFGVKVVSVESSGKDITAEYADTAAQIASLQAARARYLTILNGARTIGEVLSVQQRIDGVQGQIDRLEGSRRVLASQSDLATLTVTVSEKEDDVLIASERNGFSKAWHDAVDGFTSGVQALIAHSGRALLVLMVAAFALVVGRWAWRVARRRLI